MNPLLEVKNLEKNFPIRQGMLNRSIDTVYAVHNVSFTIDQEETLGLVGESGCGKSTLARLILLLTPPSAGHITFNGQNITYFKGTMLRNLKKHMQIIFQNPYSSLNPRFGIGDSIAEPLVVHKYGNSSKIKKRVQELMDMVSLPFADYSRYPHEFSGGQRQRVVIARALALNPQFIVADEPVSALDVSIQAQIINLLNDLKKELNLTYLFISHNLNVVHYISDRVAVMYLGEIVEIGLRDEIYQHFRHPYTEALLHSILTPHAGKKKTDRYVLDGDVPSPIHRPTGCFFHPRCPYAEEICKIDKPAYTHLSDTHTISCHFPEKVLH